MKRALIVVDLQKDFCPGGALPAEKGNDIVPTINKILPDFDFVIASKDWHPNQTVHFEKWPVHCVRGSEGASFHKDLIVNRIDKVALKGTGNTDDGYSAFEATNLNMDFELKKHNIDEVYVCGLVTEYCVCETALDAQQLGFQVYVISDAVAPVEQNSGDHEKALEKMKKEGVRVVTSDEMATQV